MGKIKVSFTTALFVFSFIICVIVAVVFVDRGPGNDYDSFYDEDRGEEMEDRAESRNNGSTGANEWKRGKQDQPQAPAATPAPTSEVNLADLPLDPHLVGAAQPVPNAPTPATAQATPNPHVGKSPEQIARELMSMGGVPIPQQSPTIPGMAIPGGIATPAQQAVATATPQSAPARTSSYLPMQSNIGGVTGAGGTGSPFASPGGFSGPSSAPSLSATTNMGSAYDPMAARQTPDRMIGVRSAPGDDSGMMISRGKSEVSEPPLGFDPGITQGGTVPAFSGTGNSSTAPGGQAPLLLPPDATPPGGGKWDLPAAPTLRPPPIQDPDQRRSDADSPDAGSETPDSMNPEGFSGQALAVSGADGATTVVSAEPDAVAARVNDKELTEDQAARLAQVTAKLAEETVTPENRQEKITEAVRDWTAVMAAAEEAKKQELQLSQPEIDTYAARRTEFEIDEWKKSMAQVGFTKAEIEQHLSAIALSEKLVEAETEKKYPEAELRKMYEKSPKEYYSPRQVHVLEIFKGKPEDEKQASRVSREMSRLQRQAAGGTDFGLLARTTSDASSKSKGGDIGWVTPEEKEKNDPEFAKAVAELKPGQVSEVVQSERGFHIYKIVAEKEARDDFEGAKEVLTEKLKNEMRDKVLADAKEKQEVELGPKKEIKVAESDPDPKAKKESGEPAGKKETASTPKHKPVERSRPIQQAAASDQLLFAPGTELEQRAGGASAPVHQPGGQPAVEQRVATTTDQAGRYAPGQTMRIGNEAENPSPAAAAAPQNYAAPLQVGAVATPDPNLTPEEQALQLRAMQAKRQQEEQQQNAQVEAQIQAARAYAARQAQAQEQAMNAGNPSLQQAALGQGLAANSAQAPVASAQQPIAEGAPVPPQPPGQEVTQSNGWTVTRREVDHEARAAAAQAARQQPADRQADSSGGPGIPPGFEGNLGSPAPSAAPAAAAPATAAAQQQPAAEEKQRGGFLSGVRNLFGRDR